VRGGRNYCQIARNLLILFAFWGSAIRDDPERAIKGVVSHASSKEEKSQEGAREAEGQEGEEEEEIASR
jgi:hypothetical protein